MAVQPCSLGWIHRDHGPPPPFEDFWPPPPLPPFAQPRFRAPSFRAPPPPEPFRLRKAAFISLDDTTCFPTTASFPLVQLEETMMDVGPLPPSVPFPTLLPTPHATATGDDLASELEEDESPFPLIDVKVLLVARSLASLLKERSRLAAGAASKARRDSLASEEETVQPKLYHPKKKSLVERLKSKLGAKKPPPPPVAPFRVSKQALSASDPAEKTATPKEKGAGFEKVKFAMAPPKAKPAATKVDQSEPKTVLKAGRPKAAEPPTVKSSKATAAAFKVLQTRLPLPLHKSLGRNQSALAKLAPATAPASEPREDEKPQTPGPQGHVPPREEPEQPEEAKPATPTPEATEAEGPPKSEPEEGTATPKNEDPDVSIIPLDPRPPKKKRKPRQKRLPIPPPPPKKKVPAKAPQPPPQLNVPASIRTAGLSTDCFPDRWHKLESLIQCRLNKLSGAAALRCKICGAVVPGRMRLKWLYRHIVELHPLAQAFLRCEADLCDTTVLLSQYGKHRWYHSRRSTAEPSRFPNREPRFRAVDPARLQRAFDRQLKAIVAA